MASDELEKNAPAWGKRTLYSGKSGRRPMEMAVDMGFDAMRICVGAKPLNFEYAEVMRWMKLMNPEANHGE